MSALTVRPARSEDVAALATVAVASYASGFAGILEPEVLASRDAATFAVAQPALGYAGLTALLQRCIGAAGGAVLGIQPGIQAGIEGAPSQLGAEFRNLFAKLGR